MSYLIDKNSITEVVKAIEKTGIPAERIAEEEPLKNHTSFRIGGPAALFITCFDERELSSVLAVLTRQEIEHLIIGNGSDLLFDDKGYPGVIVKMGGDFEKIELADEDTICAGSEALLSRVSSFACKKSLSGMEFASGIPGSIGGAVFMNAGAYGGEMKQIVDSVRVMAKDGSKTAERSGEDMDFSYRHSAIQEDGEIVLSVKLKLEKGEKSEIEARIAELTEKRKSKQPINYPSAGSFFKRPVGGYAAALIEQSGLKGFRIGDAMVSDKHSGFVINAGHATFDDVMKLMETVQDKVYKDSGIMLEPEVRIIRYPEGE